jgi:adenylate kinase
MTKPYTFVFFGIVGSGKGTQVELLEKYLKENLSVAHFVHASSGSEYRKIVASGNYTSTLIKGVLEAGKLQPDFLTNGLFVSILTSNMQEDSCIVADGFPRSISQSETFEKAMAYYSRNDVHIIYIEVGKEEAIKRMKLRARSDDHDEGIANRFDEYINNVVPAMNYFKDKSGYTIHTINGEQSIEDVHKEIIASLGI